jgi:hypothetical protein
VSILGGTEALSGLMFAKPNESHADTNDKYAQQALPADPLVQEQRGAQGPGCVIQSRHRHDESYTFKDSMASRAKNASVINPIPIHIQPARVARRTN